MFPDLQASASFFPLHEIPSGDEIPSGVSHHPTHGIGEPLNGRSSHPSALQSFTEAHKKVFDHAIPGREAALGLFNLVQGERRVADSSIEFWMLASESKWKALSLHDAFYNGLSSVIKVELAA